MVRILVKVAVLAVPTLVLVWFLGLSKIQVIAFLGWYFLHDYLNEVFRKTETNTFEQER